MNIITFTPPKMGLLKRFKIWKNTFKDKYKGYIITYTILPLDCRIKNLQPFKKCFDWNHDNYYTKENLVKFYKRYINSLESMKRNN